MSESIIHITDDSFDQEVLQSDTPVLVDYWAEWCGPCKMIAPALDELAKEYSGRLKVAKINIDENSKITSRFGIRGIPTLMLFKTAMSRQARSARCPRASSASSLTPTSETISLDSSWLFARNSRAKPPQHFAARPPLESSSPARAMHSARRHPSRLVS
jgi:thioredoxin 1